MSTPSNAVVKTPVNFRENLPALKAAARGQSMMNSPFQASPTLDDPGVRSRTLGLDLISAPWKKIRPNFVFPFTSLIRVDTSRLPKNANP